MPLFLSTYVNKVDRKGRVSVPAGFRAAADESGFDGVALYRPFEDGCIEGADLGFLQQLSDRLYGDFGPFEPDQQAVATAILAEAHQLAWDPEGRIKLPDDLKTHAGIGDMATFVGVGRKFQIWEPGAFEGHRARQRERARKAAPTLPALGPVSVAPRGADA